MSLFDYVENTDYSNLIPEPLDNQESYEVIDSVAISYMGNNDSSDESDILIISDDYSSNSESSFSEEQFETLVQYYDDISSDIDNVVESVSSMNLFVVIVGLVVISDFIFKKLKIRKVGDL